MKTTAETVMSDGGTIGEQKALPQAAQSTQLASTPRFTHRALTIALIAMCIVPLVLLTALFIYLPPVYEGQLDARVWAEGLPAAEFYESPYDQRPDVPDGELVIVNTSDHDWTHLNIQINRHYQIYEREPIPAGQTRRFKLSRFITRTGATFELKYNPIKHVRIYARRPTRDRATFETDIDGEHADASGRAFPPDAPPQSPGEPAVDAPIQPDDGG